MKRTIALAAMVGFACAGSAWAQAPSSFISEGQARAMLTAAGCSNVSVLSRGPTGSWHGTCTKGGSTQTMMVGKDGKVSAAAAQHITEAHARAALMQYGCSNVSALSVGPTGSWHGQCSKGGSTQTMMVAPDGTVSQAPAAHLTEAHARSVLTQFGCSNISALNSGPDGSWIGQCSKGGRTSNVAVNAQGTPSVQ